MCAHVTSFKVFVKWMRNDDIRHEALKKECLTYSTLNAIESFSFIRTRVILRLLAQPLREYTFYGLKHVRMLLMSSDQFSRKEIRTKAESSQQPRVLC